jgi:2-polyprenyl-6-methoxyphenol hydroxylase-like FAD-dependent oxidoreductase
MEYDAIVVGARCAGSPTAMLLARKGYRVLLVDRATFPSDVVNGYYVQQTGGARLQRWGLLDRLRDSNCPPLRTLTFDFGDFSLSGSPPALDGVVEGYAPRRTALDKILVDAAVEGGAELREGFPVEGLLWEGDRVTGVRSITKSGATATERARIVIGADGTNSIVARAVNAPAYNARPTLTCWYTAHWSGVPAKGVEFYLRERRVLIVGRTNDGLTAVIAGLPYDEFFEFRKDVKGNYFKTLDLVAELAERVRSGKREERFLGTADTANFFRRPYGPGWALVGDAGYHKDPSTAQGISDSFRDAELLSDAIDQGFSGRRSPENALADYERERNAAVMPMYEFTLQLANLAKPAPPEILQLLRALRGNQSQTNQFMGVWAGTVPIPEFFAPENVNEIMALAHGVTSERP